MSKQPENIHKDEERGFSIKYPKEWMVLSNDSYGESEKKYGSPFLYIFQKDRKENYERGEGMGPNVNIGYVKLKSHHPNKDFEMQCSDLPNSIPEYEKISVNFDSDSETGRIEGASNLGDPESHFIQYYYYHPGSINNDPIVATVMYQSFEKVVVKTLEDVAKSFRFSSGKKEGGTDDVRNYFEQERIEKEKRLDAIVNMQGDLASTKMRYYVLFVVGLIVALVVLSSLFTISFFEGLMLFVAGFWSLRYLLINKILVRKYNMHVGKVYKKSDVSS